MRGSSPRMTTVCGTAPALQRTTSQELRAALRPGNANLGYGYFFFTSLMLENTMPSARSLV